jgi:hypothetical protein
VDNSRFVGGAPHFDKGRLLFPTALTLKMGGECLGAALQIPGAAGIEFGADDFAIDFAKLADEKNVGQ